MRHLAICSLLGACAMVQPGVRQAALPSRSPAPKGATFEDATQQLGLALSGGAAAWGDFNNDGFADLYCGGVLWQNQAGLTFTKVPTPGGGSSGIWGDFDNDGFLDIYCWGDGMLLRNTGEGGFVDATAILPERTTTVCRGAVWGDFNRDGFLDLFVGGYEIWPSEEYPDVIYMNNGGESFTELWRTKGKVLRARGITAADYDEDGFLDVYVSNYRLQPNQLWRNKGEWGSKGADKFSDVAPAVGAHGEQKQGYYGHTIGSTFGDLDSDGHLDLFVGNFSHPPDYQDRPKFLKNLGPQGGWKFQDQSAGAGLEWQESFASPALGDYDNDGLLDLFFTTVYPRDDSVLYRNTGAWTFTDVTQPSGVRSRLTYQASWCDFDNDGDLDLITQAKLYRNRGNANHRLKVTLRGHGACNRAAIGALVRARYSDYVQARQVSGGSGEGSQDDLTLHFGLGNYGGPVQLEIRWPDNTTQLVYTYADRALRVEQQPPADPQGPASKSPRP